MLDAFRTVAGRMPEPMLLMVGGTIVCLNESARGLLGYHLEGRPLQEVVANEPEDLRQYLRNCTRSGQPVPGSLAIRLADGSNSELLAHGVIVEPATDETPAHVMLRLRPRSNATERFELLNSQIDRLNREILERQRAEEEARRLNEQLEDLVRERTAALTSSNADLEAFCYSVSHDLRAPLRSIAAASMLLLEDAADRMNEEDRVLLKRQAEAAARMGHLIDGLLRLSRLGKVELRKSEFDLSGMAESIASQIMDESLPFEGAFRIQSGMAVRADEHLLRFALHNLMENAVKFTAPRGPQGLVEVGSERWNGTAAYFVRDNGIGFDMRYAGRLFLPFERLHDATEFAGTGIGLANVHRIVTRHGGEIWAEGIPGEGATFRFTLA